MKGLKKSMKCPTQVNITHTQTHHWESSELWKQGDILQTCRTGWKDGFPTKDGELAKLHMSRSHTRNKAVEECLQSSERKLLSIYIQHLTKPIKCKDRVKPLSDIHES